MERFYVITILAFSTFLSGCVSATPPDVRDRASTSQKAVPIVSSSTKEYRVEQARTDTQEGFSIRYPDNWLSESMTQEMMGSVVVSAVDPNAIEDKRYGAPCFMVVVQQNPNKPADKLYENMIPMYRKADPSAVYSTESFSISGYTAYKLGIEQTRVQRCVHAGTEKKFSTDGSAADMIIDTELNRYMLSYTYGADEKGALETLEAIVKSFTVLP